MNETIMRINNLTKSYGAKTVLDNVSFEIEKGKIYGFIGENGAGKTTAIRAITGLSPIDQGSIELFGKSDKNGLVEARRKIGCLVEKPILELNKTARANLISAQLLYGNNDSAKIDKVLQRVGLGDVKNKKVGDFSLGMKQRLGIAMALINNPEMLILDEPVNGLDPMGMVDVRELLISLCRDDGITIVISSHILAELYQLATDYIIISHGRIISTFSKNALDDLCTTHIVMNTECNDTALEILAANGMSGVDNDEGTIMIFDNVDTRDVAKLMHDHNLLVTHLAKHERTLEEYYIELLGRGA
ncbi:MAG: ATP-binding cassette domain-containing protein [Clostridiales bacterium]|jgi:ABC-2 type transport system ATP-binding protein|nr:ATP-binding cassette domain-containing protein [Clostridiales bacterium]